MNNNRLTPKHGKIGLMALAPAMVLACAGNAVGSPPDPGNYKSLTGYLTALKTSTYPDDVNLIKQIKDGPSALAAERAECKKRGISVVQIRLNVPDDKNAYLAYAKWIDMRKSNPASVMNNLGESMGPRLAFTSEQLAAVQKIFDDNPDVYGQLHLAAGLPQYQLPVGVTGMSVSGHLREGAREIHAESYLLANRGDYTDAISLQTLGLNMANQVRSGSAVGGYLLGSALDGIGYISLQDTMVIAAPNADVDQQVTDAVRKTQPTETLKDVLIAEIPEELALYDAARSDPGATAVAGIQRLTGLYEFENSAMTNDASPADIAFVSDIADASEAEFIKQQLKAIDASKLSGPSRTSAFRAIDIDGNANPGDPGSFNPIAAYSFLDSYDNTLKAKEEVILAAAVVMKTKAQTGSFPKTLSSGFVDPFTDSALHYETDGATTCLIYSVGPKGTYDGKTRDSMEASFQYPAPPKQPVTDWVK